MATSVRSVSGTGAALIVLSLLLAACGTADPASPSSSRSPVTSPALPAETASPSLPPTPSSDPTRTSPYSKVLVIAEENKTYEQVLHSGQAPYLEQLAARYANAEAMDAGYPPACPSLAAYLLMTSGSRVGVCDDKDPAQHQVRGPNIFSQVAESGRQWRVYAEAMPGPCRRTNAGRYLVRHAPAPYYVTERARCPRWDVPLGGLGAGALHDDLKAGRLPAYAFVTPDACNDMHGAPGCARNQVATGDAWLASWVPQILAGPDYRAGRLIVIITWDEGTVTDNHIATVLIAPTAGKLRVRERLTHCSMLRLTEETLGLPLLGCAADVPSPRSAFHLS